jgi:hypothetical protein
MFEAFAWFMQTRASSGIGFDEPATLVSKTNSFKLHFGIGTIPRNLFTPIYQPRARCG